MSKTVTELRALLIALAGLLAVGLGAMQFGDVGYTQRDLLGQAMIVAGTVTILWLVKNLVRQKQN